MSEQLKITGTIILIGETQSFGDNGFTKREFVVEVGDKYPQPIAFEMVKDNCELLDAYNEGDEVGVSFNLRGREYYGKYYVNLTCWRLARVGTAVNAAPAAAVEEEDEISF